MICVFKGIDENGQDQTGTLALSHVRAFTMDCLDRGWAHLNIKPGTSVAGIDRPNGGAPEAWFVPEVP